MQNKWRSRKRGKKLPGDIKPIKRNEPKFCRNKECFCGSGLKYKRCCLLSVNALDQAAREEELLPPDPMEKIINDAMIDDFRRTRDG